MCMMIYLAADQPLRMIPWNDADPGFHVSAPAPDEERVRCQFKSGNVVYAGAYEGCGCGFQYGQYPSENYESQELEQRRRSLNQFAEYLRGELARVGAIEAYACWDGDQDSPPEHHRTLTPSSLEADDFFFHQKELSTLVEDAG